MYNTSSYSMKLESMDDEIKNQKLGTENGLIMILVLPTLHKKTDNKNHKQRHFSNPQKMIVHDGFIWLWKGRLIS